MKQRAISGTVFMAVILAAILSGPLGFTALLVAIAVGGLWELYGNMEKTGAVPHFTHKGILVFIGGCATGLYAVFHLYYLPLETYFIIPLLLLAPLVLSLVGQVSSALVRASMATLGFGYVVLCTSSLVHWAQLGSVGYQHHYLIGGLALIWSNDVFAYLLGRRFGRKKLAPALSPKKTWEGSLGGLFMAMVAGVVTAGILGEPTWAWMGFGLVCGICATLGDLIESAFKRSLGVKDMGNLIPGHGGVLDRFDALLFAGPVGAAYIQWVFL
jgi:phosphatidate cytidylyltransferase